MFADLTRIIGTLPLSDSLMTAPAPQSGIVNFEPSFPFCMSIVVTLIACLYMIIEASNYNLLPSLPRIGKIVNSFSRLCTSHSKFCEINNSRKYETKIE